MLISILVSGPLHNLSGSSLNIMPALCAGDPGRRWCRLHAAVLRSVCPHYAQEIQAGDGAGIMLLCCAALPKIYLEPGGGLPPDVLKFDCRGLMLVTRYVLVMVSA